MFGLLIVNDNSLSLKLKLLIYVFILVELAFAVMFMFFQDTLASAFDTKVLDPEISRLFGAAIFFICYMFILGLRSNSVIVIRMVLKAYILYNLLLILGTYINYTTIGLNPLQVYVGPVLLHTTLIFLSLWGLKLGKT